MNQIVELKPSADLVAVAESCKAIAGVDLGIARIFARATKVKAIRDLMARPEMMEVIKTLAGNPAGFLLPKGKPVPSDLILRAVCTDALIKGARLDGGEFLIMNDGLFLTKPYYGRTLDELGHEGGYTSDCRYRMEWHNFRQTKIEVAGKQAEVHIEITYKLFDKDKNIALDTRVETFPCWIRVYDTDTPDKWVGLAERRAFSLLLRKLARVDLDDDGSDYSSNAAPQPPTVGKVGLGKESPKEPQPQPEAEDAVSTPVEPVVQEPETQPAPQPVKQEAPKGDTKKPYVEPVKLFQQSWIAAKPVLGLPACKALLAAEGFENVMPKDIPEMALLTLAEKLDKLVAERLKQENTGTQPPPPELF